MQRYSLALLLQGFMIYINPFNTTDVIARSYPDTSPIYFYHRGKSFFECARTSPLCLQETSCYLCLLSRFTNFSMHSVEYNGKIYATAEHRAWGGHTCGTC